MTKLTNEAVVSIDLNSSEFKQAKAELLQVLNSPFQVFKALNQLKNKVTYISNLYKVLEITKVDFNAFSDSDSLYNFVSVNGIIQYYEKPVLCASHLKEDGFENVGLNIAEYKPLAYLNLLNKIARAKQAAAKKAIKAAAAAAKNQAKAEKAAAKKAEKIEKIKNQILSSNPDITAEKAQSIAESIAA